MPKIPYHHQETSRTCGPAAARMALEALGILATEHQLAKLLHTGDQTLNAHFPRLAEHYKLNYIVKRHATYANLADAAGQGYEIIVCYFDEKERVGHYAFVQKIGASTIHLFDPWYGPYTQFSRKEFVHVWHNGFENEERWFIGFVKPLA